MSVLGQVRAGQVGVMAGVLGVLTAVFVLAWPPQVAPGPMHYPFTVQGFTAVQTWFFVHHVGLVALLAALARCGAVGAGKPARAGAWVAVVGMVMLACMELVATQYAEVDARVANEGPMGAGYGVASTLIGLGLIAAGAGVRGAGAWTGWHRSVPMALGVMVFVVVTPGLMMGFVAGRLVIAAWMVVFGALGWAMVVEARRS